MKKPLFVTMKGEKIINIESLGIEVCQADDARRAAMEGFFVPDYEADLHSTRLNSIHITISYAVFFLKKKKNT